MKPPVIDLDKYLPDSDSLTLSDVAMSMKAAMVQIRCTRSEAECPFCDDGLLEAAIVGNFRRVDMVCHSCRKSFTESFRSAMRPREERKKFVTVYKSKRQPTEGD